MSSDADEDKLKPAGKEDLAAALVRRFRPENKLDVLMIAHYTQVSAHTPDRGAHPVFWPLWNAYVSRLEKYLETPRIQKSVEKLKELEELRPWIMPSKPVKWTDDHDSLAGDVLVKRHTYSEAKENIQQVRQLGAGRPRTNVAIAIRGLELKTVTPTLTWEGVCEKVCDCGKSQHDASCLGRLKSAVTELKSILTKYEPTALR